MPTKTVLPLLALSLAIGAGCASGGGPPERRVAPDVAAGLAARAEQVATALDAGHCDQALAGARSLQNDIAALPVDPALRADALAGASRLVSGITCPVATTPTAVPAVTAPDSWINEKGRKGKGDKGDDDDD